MQASNKKFIQQRDIFILIFRLTSNFLATIVIIGVTTTPARANIPKDRPIIASTIRADRVFTEEATPPNRGQKNPQSTPTAVMNSLELSTHNLVNKYRQSRNLPPLIVSPAISAQAKVHSLKMARSGVMNHDGFDERVDSVSKTIIYRSAAENVAYNMGYGQPDLVAVQGWIESPGHQHNMLGRYDLTGIGVAKNARGEYFFTQIFIRKAWDVKDASNYKLKNRMITIGTSAGNIF
jgi:uncharacterized protein YkwD